ncbi:PCYCGC motif-containing (lipo)protein [Psychrobacillus psychrodurans]|uniref:PCYCGC domain-containing protein n=1 Tax=Psychrobacillus psychrodurans TaxID=126157 RepID=A0A9X3LAJ0_9BACI|nr:PCYCGC motif-containing (lipo)protein [Psychrobacillus psychrodurans]MCZ8534440.1 PCYCGC domain-containing protein [Psychrobacillus psychrodurans]
MKKTLFILLACILLLSACAQENKKENHEEHENHVGHLENGDLQETTESTDILPAFLDTQSEDMKLVYQAASKANDVLKWMPCYCGCGDSADHKNNFNCFVHEIKENGEVVWDDHGTRCAACLETAITSIQMIQEGKSLVEIRNTIDETYKDGYATPTDTPMPS